jgi:SAM-dependent methyltransferase
MSTDMARETIAPRSGPPRIFDAHARALRLARAAHAYGREAFLGIRAADIAADRLADTVRSFGDALFLGPAGALAAGLVPPDKAGTFRVLGPSPPDGVLDAKELSADLIVSVLDLHAIDDPVGSLIQANRILRPDGLFVGVCFCGETLKELRTVLAEAEMELEGGLSPRVFPFLDVREGGALLQRAGFALPVADVERVTVRYREPLRLLADLRAMGETNVLTARRKRFWRRATLMRAMALYRERFAGADGKVPATFELAVLTAWAPHESQPKPLRPGSARVRLADALGTRERSAGEKPGG